MLSLQAEVDDEFRDSGAGGVLGWGGSRAVRMVRKERSPLSGAGRGVGVCSRLRIVDAV